jgi:NitT/TauT family transport system substrate-binding protein
MGALLRVQPLKRAERVFPMKPCARSRRPAGNRHASWKGISWLFILLHCLFGAQWAAARETGQVRLAVEFLDHAACAHIARSRNWYRLAGLEVQSFDSYATGMALSAALAKGGIDAAYMCLFPAINAYANARVPLKIVAGTHRYGYGLVVNPTKIRNVADLGAPGIRLGCTGEGSPPAALLHRLVDRFHLDASLVRETRRMPPAKLLLSLRSGQIDGAFMPEQYPTMGEADGFRELVRAADLWPGMQGSVLVVTQRFLETHPEVVEKLVGLTERGIAYIRTHPAEAARLVADELTAAGRQTVPLDPADTPGNRIVSAGVIQASLTRKMENTTAIDPAAVQAAIDYAARIGYIRHSFPAGEILYLRYLHD